MSRKAAKKTQLPKKRGNILNLQHQNRPRRNFSLKVSLRLEVIRYG